MSKCIQFIVYLCVLVGCQKYSEYRETPQGGIVITPQGIEVKDLKVVRWKVGRDFKKEVSKGIKFHFTLPMLEKEHFKTLLRKGVDSWIVKVDREKVISSENLDHFTIPLVVVQKRIIGKNDFKPMRSGRINIFYASSFVSSDKSTLVCPALGHRKVIKELDIERGRKFEQNISVSIVNESSMRFKSEYLGYEPEKINGGKSLEGTYIIELALYSKKKQRLMSNWFRINEKIVIGTEKEIVLKGCPLYNRSVPFGGG